MIGRKCTVTSVLNFSCVCAIPLLLGLLNVQGIAFKFGNLIQAVTKEVAWADWLVCCCLPSPYVLFF